MKEKITDELLEEVKEKAKNNLLGVISPNKLGYTKLFQLEMKKILAEMGIEWNSKDDSTSID